MLGHSAKQSGVTVQQKAREVRLVPWRGAKVKTLTAVVALLSWLVLASEVVEVRIQAFGLGVCVSIMQATNTTLVTDEVVSTF